MCGRFTLSLEAEEIEKILDAVWAGDPAEFSPCWNTAPSMKSPVLSSEASAREIHMMEWGIRFPSESPETSAGEKNIINIKIESLSKKTGFKKLLASRRCLVIATGFYEWKKEAGSAPVPFFIFPPEKKLFLFAGLWYTPNYIPGRATLKSFSIITGPAPGKIGEIHDRAPVVVNEKYASKWLDNEHTAPAEALGILSAQEAHAMDFYSVSPKVNSVANNSPDLVKKYDYPEQPELF